MPHTAHEVVQAVHISQVYSALTGQQPRHSVAARYRAAATWRDGDGLNVSLDDTKGRWYDHKTHEGGGVLDLVARVHGSNRKEALKWLADYAHMPLAEQTHEAKQNWRQTRVSIERDLPDARLWKRAAVSLGEDELDRLKQSIVDPALPQTAPGQIAAHTAQVARWREIDGAALVEEYQRWKTADPKTTQQMVDLARDEQRELMWLLTHQQAFRDDLATSENRVINQTTGRTYHDEVRLGIADLLMEEILIREERLNLDRQNLKPARELTNDQIVAETQQLHERFAMLTEQYFEASSQDKRGEIKRDMESLVQRENELRKAYIGTPGQELAQDRAPQEIAIGYGR